MRGKGEMGTSTKKIRSLESDNEEINREINI